MSTQPSYRLHKASGQAVVTLAGKTIYLGKFDSPASRKQYSRVLADFKKSNKLVANVPKSKIPSYRLHKSSGQALVTLNYRDYYLGVHGSPESKQEYDRLIAEYLSCQRSNTFGVVPSEISLNELLVAFQEHTRSYYGVGAESEWHRFKPLVKRMRELYGADPATKFGAVQYKTVRQYLLDQTLSRTYINSQMKRVRRIFRWGAAEELVPPSIQQLLSLIAPLKQGRSTARETEPIKPVTQAAIDATLPYLNPVAQAMVKFQALVGCRPGEVCLIMPSMVDRSADVWEIHIEKHKTQWRGKKRTLYVGPKAQEILQPFLQCDADSYCFSPAEGVRLANALRHAARTTPLSHGNRPGHRSEKKGGDTTPKIARLPGACYSNASYGKAIARACKKAGIESWAPNRIRHTVGTKVRKEFGLEAASVILGHSEMNVTQVYAEADRSKAISIVRQTG